MLAEARIAANLQHTNIVQVHDVGIEDGVVFIAMEYLHGQDLRAILDRAWGTRRPLGLDPEIAIALSMCAGLHYAHDKRDVDGSQLEIVHRDISPSNVIVTYDGSVKIIDFGIAKATSLPSETQLGTVKGKPGYMSPEQCRSELLDRRSDVFCLGIVLYELTTGIRPFGGDSEYEIAKAIVELEPVWPRAIDSAYAPELEAIVRRALAKDRRDRFPTAHAMHAELSALASRKRLDVSQFALQRAMASLFQAELGAWEAARATEESLVEFVMHRTATTRALALVPPPPPDAFSTIEGTATVEERRPAMIAATAQPPPEAEPPRVRKTGLAAVAGVIAAAIAGGAVWHFAAASGDPAPMTEPRAVAAPPPPTATATATVTPVDAAIVEAPAEIDAAISVAAPVPVPASPPASIHRVGSAPPRPHEPPPPPPRKPAVRHSDPDEIIR